MGFYESLEIALCGEVPAGALQDMTGKTHRVFGGNFPRILRDVVPADSPLRRGDLGQEYLPAPVERIQGIIYHTSCTVAIRGSIFPSYMGCSYSANNWFIAPDGTRRLGNFLKPDQLRRFAEFVRLFRETTQAPTFVLGQTPTELYQTLLQAFPETVPLWSPLGFFYRNLLEGPPEGADEGGPAEDPPGAPLAIEWYPEIPDCPADIEHIHWPSGTRPHPIPPGEALTEWEEIDARRERICWRPKVFGGRWSKSPKRLAFWLTVSTWSSLDGDFTPWYNFLPGEPVRTYLFLSPYEDHPEAIPDELIAIGEPREYTGGLLVPETCFDQFDYERQGVRRKDIDKMLSTDTSPFAFATEIDIDLATGQTVKWWRLPII